MWTKEKPTKEGWYWYRGLTTSEYVPSSEVCRVKYSNRFDGLAVWWNGWDIPEGLAIVEAGEWQKLTPPV